MGAALWYIQKGAMIVVDWSERIGTIAVIVISIVSASIALTISCHRCNHFIAVLVTRGSNIYHQHQSGGE